MFPLQEINNNKTRNKNRLGINAQRTIPKSKTSNRSVPSLKQLKGAGKMKKKKLSLWKRIRMHFWTQNRIIEELHNLDRILESRMNIWAAIIKELDQDKIYQIKIDDISEMEEAKLSFKKLRDTIPWTMPFIIVTNKAIKELSKAELRAIAVEYKKLKERENK